MSKKFLGTWMLTAFLASMVAMPAMGATGRARTGERILDYHADIAVHKDSSITVTETIKVRAEHNKIRHGIYRDLPTDYFNRGWGKTYIGYDVLEVTRDGKHEPWHTGSDKAGYLRIYVGAKSALVPKGVHTYTIKYKPTRTVLGFFDKHDEIYWNVTGNEWDFPIDKASATATLPGGIPTEKITHEAYTGPKGAKGKDYKSWLDKDGKVQFAATRPLKKGEGLTIVATFPKGFVTPPSRSERIAQFLGDNAMVLIGLAGLIAVLVYYGIAWVMVGRDPAKGVIFPQYEPPDGMDPASVRYVLKMGFDQKCLVAEVLSLAVKRRLEINEKSGEFTLHRTDRGGGQAMLGIEMRTLNKLFAHGGRLKLHKKNNEKIRGAVKDLKAALSERYKGVLFLTNIGWFIPGAALTGATIVGIGLASLMLTGQPVVAFLGFWLSIWTLGCAGLLRGIVSAWANLRSSHGIGMIGSIGGAVFVTLFALPFLVIEAAVLGYMVYMTSIWLLPVLLALVVANIGFFQLLKKPTPQGRKVMDQIEGLRMYLATGEQDRLEAATPPERTPKLFEKFLPFAMALGVENQWAEKFEDVLSAATAAGEYQPGWYRGGTFTTLGAAAFAGSLSSSLSSSIASSSSAPGSSSGAGGGGSSGGGGGGGGGGGW